MDEPSATSPRVVRHVDAAGFLARAEEWLLRAEAEHNLILGITGALRSGSSAYEPPYYLATIEHDGEIVGCAFRTPPYKLGLTRMPDEAARALAQDIARTYDTLPAVLGPVDATRTFADAWSAHTGTVPRDAARNRIYQLDRVSQGLPFVPGGMRTATEADFDLVVRWIEAFHDDVKMPLRLSDRAYRDRITGGGIVLWETDGAPVSLAGSTGPTRHGIRVGPVYTPAEHRRHGYATALVAALSRRLLDAGRRFCFLYTDLDNPTSNDIYRQIGYAPVCDVVDIVFTPRGAPRADRHVSPA
jgi:hypothetical protein